MKTVAVIGGTGFLGRHVVPALRAGDREVRVLSRRTGCDARRIDPDALRGCDAVVNLAGIKREDGEQTFQAVHVDLVARILEAMKAAGVKRLVHISVVVARPDADLPYHDTKWKGEELIRASGLEWTILRPGVIYGAGDDLLGHLAKMINAAPVFPIVNDGSAPMMPIHAGDVAAGVAAALERPASAGKTYDLVGPDRMTLRDVVRTTAAALGRPVWIVPTPAGLMRGPVRIMEATMKQPLSTRAQLAMIVEGLPGDPGPARAELGVEPAPFTPEKIRPMVQGIPREVPAPVAIGLYAAAAALLTFAFRGPIGAWKGMTLVMGVLLAASLLVRAVRSRLSPTLPRVALGLAAGAVLYGLTRAGLIVLDAAWPGWTAQARTLSAWKEGHSTGFLLTTLVMIVIAEETLWRGVVSRFMVERFGRLFGIVAGAALYSAAHAGTMSPLLALAAFGCGIYWGLLADATDDLTASIVSHLAWDIMIMFVVPVV
jgi:uncharacterized protein YbjT (DUF2867 family)/membrane protease YdiL (CAAX protease family)